MILFCISKFSSQITLQMLTDNNPIEAGLSMFIKMKKVSLVTVLED